MELFILHCATQKLSYAWRSISFVANILALGLLRGLVLPDVDCCELVDDGIDFEAIGVCCCDDAVPLL